MLKTTDIYFLVLEVPADMVRPHFLVQRWLSSCCVLTWQNGKGALQGLCRKGISPVHEGSSLMTSLPLKGLSLNTVTLGIKPQQTNFRETNSGHSTAIREPLWWITLLPLFESEKTLESEAERAYAGNPRVHINTLTNQPTNQVSNLGCSVAAPTFQPQHYSICRVSGLSP